MQICELYFKPENSESNIQEFRSKDVTVHFPNRVIGYSWTLTKCENGSYTITCSSPKHFERFVSTLDKVAIFNADSLKLEKRLEGVEEAYLDTFNPYLATLNLQDLSAKGEIQKAKDQIEQIIQNTKKIEFTHQGVTFLVELMNAQNLSDERLNKLIEHLKKDLEEENKKPVRIYHIDARTNREIYDEEAKMQAAWDGSYTFMDETKIERRKRTPEETEIERKDNLERTKKSLPAWDW